MQSNDEATQADTRWLQALEATGLELGPARLRGIRADLEAVRRNIARIEALDAGVEDPAIGFSADPQR